MTAPKQGYGSRVTAACLSPPFRSSQTAYCYTYGQLYAGRDITVSRNSLVGDYRQHLRIGRLVPFIFVGPVYYNALKNCAALSSPRGPSLALRAIHLVPRLLRLSVLCSSMLSGTANISRNKRNGNPTAVPLLGAVAGLWSASG